MVRRDGRLDAHDHSGSGEALSARATRHVFRPAAALSRHLLSRRQLLLRWPMPIATLPRSIPPCRRSSPKSIQRRPTQTRRRRRGASMRLSMRDWIERYVPGGINSRLGRLIKVSYRQRVWARGRRAERAESGDAARGTTPLRPRSRDERSGLLRPAVHLGQREPVASRGDRGMVAGGKRHTQLPASGDPAYA